MWNGDPHRSVENVHQLSLVEQYVADGLFFQCSDNFVGGVTQLEGPPNLPGVTATPKPSQPV